MITGNVTRNLLFLILSLGIAGAVSSAQTSKVKRPNQKENNLKSEVLNGAKLHKIGGISRTDLSLVSDYRAFPNSSGPASKTGFRKIGTLLNFNVYKKSEGAPTEGYQLVLNEATGRVGIFTGEIIIKVNDRDEAVMLALKYGLLLKLYLPGQNKAILKSNDPSVAAQTFEQMKNDPMIKEIDIYVQEDQIKKL